MYCQFWNCFSLRPHIGISFTDSTNRCKVLRVVLWFESEFWRRKYFLFSGTAPLRFKWYWCASGFSKAQFLHTWTITKKNYGLGLRSVWILIRIIMIQQGWGGATMSCWLDGEQIWLLFFLKANIRSKSWKKGGKEENFTVLEGKNIILENGRGGKNINNLDNIHLCDTDPQN